MARELFPKSIRLRRRADFLRVQERGTKVTAGPLLALALVRADGETRLGLTVSRKVGGAVVRTRLRRRLRELFRKQRTVLPAGLDVVLVARAGAAAVSFAELGRAYLALGNKLREKLS